MKTIHFQLSLFAALPLLWSCGGEDSNDTVTPPPPTVTAPKVVSTSIADGETDIPIGTFVVKVTYDKDVNMSTDTSLQPVVTGGYLSGTATVSGKELTFSVSCFEFLTRVTITIPKGLIGVTGALADAYTFSYTTAQKPEPADNPISTMPLTTNAAARKLYTFFYEQYGKKVVSSVMADVNWNNTCAEKVYRLTGKYPAMNCYDFIHICFSPANWIDYTDIKPVKEWTDAGGLVQLMWHFNVPKTQGATDVTCTPSETTFKASNALKDGTWENEWFFGQMDKVVATLLKLKEAGIAATWRPFHEAAGNATAKQQATWTKSWFWWGYDGAETYKRLWHVMYDYFSQKGVDNLIWVWTTQNYNGNSSNYDQDLDWYPGDNYVDMVARDLYGSDITQNVQEFTEIQATYPTKMVALGECGYGTNDSQRVEAGDMGDGFSQGALWSHFMVWYQGGQGSTDTMCSDSWWKSAMSSPLVITRDQLQF